MSSQADVATPAAAIARASLAADMVGSGTSIGRSARKLDNNPRTVMHPVASARYQSPLRYPGAKSLLTPAIDALIRSATASRSIGKVDLLVEPFAGGASASLRLVGDGTVERILLADKDPLVTDFWQAAAADTEQLIDRMSEEWLRYVIAGGGTALDRWDHWRLWKPAPGQSATSRRLDAAVKCIFLNRTTFSGILHGKAGPIGGRAQSSAYGIGCRWNQDNLAERIRYVGKLYQAGRLVDVWRKSWKTTLDDVAETYKTLLPSRVIAYLDPPYVEKSSKLYRASFDPRGGYGSSRRGDDGSRPDDLLHLELAEYLRTQAQFRWVLSYDADPMLTDTPWLYGIDRMNPSPELRQVLGVKQWRISKRLVSTRYTAGGRTGKRDADELLITTLPASTVPRNNVLRALPKPGPSDPGLTCDSGIGG